MAKWWSRQPDPHDVDPIWKGPFDTEAEALASLIVQPGEDWGGSVHQESDDFDPWEGERPDPRSHSLLATRAAEEESEPGAGSQTGPHVPPVFARAVKILESADQCPFLSEEYMAASREAAVAFHGAAAALSSVDTELAAKAREVAEKLDLFTSLPWPDDPSEVETRDSIPGDRTRSDDAANQIHDRPVGDGDQADTSVAPEAARPLSSEDVGTGAGNPYALDDALAEDGLTFSNWWAVTTNLPDGVSLAEISASPERARVYADAIKHAATKEADGRWPDDTEDSGRVRAGFAAGVAWEMDDPITRKDDPLLSGGSSGHAISLYRDGFDHGVRWSADINDRPAPRQLAEVTNDYHDYDTSYERAWEFGMEQEEKADRVANHAARTEAERRWPLDSVARYPAQHYQEKYLRQGFAAGADWERDDPSARDPHPTMFGGASGTAVNHFRLGFTYGVQWSAERNGRSVPERFRR